VSDSRLHREACAVAAANVIRQAPRREESCVCSRTTQNLQQSQHALGDQVRVHALSQRFVEITAIGAPPSVSANNALRPAWQRGLPSDGVDVLRARHAACPVLHPLELSHAEKRCEVLARQKHGMSATARLSHDEGCRLFSISSFRSVGISVEKDLHCGQRWQLRRGGTVAGKCALQGWMKVVNFDVPMSALNGRV